MEMIGENGFVLNIYLAKPSGPALYDNWINCKIDIKSMHFNGRYDICLMHEELEYLYRAINEVQMTKLVTFSSLEEGLCIDLKYDIDGKYYCKFKFADQYDNCLICNVVIDYESMERFKAEFAKNMSLVRK